MSLEQAIADLTAAVKENTKALGGKPAAGGSKADDALAAEAARKAAADKAKAAAGKGKMTIEVFAQKFADWIGGAGKDKAERQARIDKLTKMNEHLGSDRVSSLPEDKWEEALGYLKQFEAGEDPFEDEGEAGSPI